MYKLMIVDDEPHTREFMRLHIPSIHPDWEVAFEATDGLEALAILQHQSVDLLITDIRMPEMDGLALTKLVAEQMPDLKVVIISGYDDFAYAKEALQYGVQDYLLKPLVREELKQTLQSISDFLLQRKAEQAAYQSMKQLSEVSHKQIVKNFLRALIMNHHVDIKALYPLIHRLKINLIEAEAILMILSLDEAKALLHRIPVRDIHIFRYILHEMTSEMVEMDFNGRVFTDDQEHTVVFLSGDDPDSLLKECRRLHTQVNSAIMKNTKFTVTGSAGLAVYDLLQLHSSYAHAQKTSLRRIQQGPGRFYEYRIEQNQSLDQVEQLFTNAALSIVDLNKSLQFSLAEQIATKFSDASLESVLQFGIHFIETAAMIIPSLTSEAKETGMNFLEEYARQEVNTSVDEIRQFFLTLMQTLTHHGETDSSINEHIAVSEAKRWINQLFAEPISQAYIAEKVGISANYLSTIFHKYVGKSYIQYLTQVRMEQAKKLLTQSPPLKIYEVSERVGYLSEKHFSHVFKQYAQMTPGEFQQSMMK